MKPRSAKQKGSRLEREWSKRLRACGVDKTARRMPMSGAIHDSKSDIITELPFSFECKNTEKWQPLAFMEQAAAGAKQHEMPVVVMSRNRMSDPYVMMSATDWLHLVKLAQETGNLQGEYGYQKRKQTGN